MVSSKFSALNLKELKQLLLRIFSFYLCQNLSLIQTLRNKGSIGRMVLQIRPCLISESHEVHSF